MKIVIFSNQDIEFAIEVGNMAFEQSGLMHPGLLFLSLGNSWPPILNGGNRLEDTRTVFHEHVTDLMTDYKILIEEICQDPRVVHFKFLPQLHVLAFGNEAER